jgi:hypothetical protein
MAFYQELNHFRNEVRMVKFSDDPAVDSGLVHCELEHVSLDDFTPDFRLFLQKANDSSGSETRRWLEISAKDGLSSISNRTLDLPMWRWKLEHENPKVAARDWDGTMKAIGIDSYAYPVIGGISHFSFDSKVSVGGLRSYLILLGIRYPREGNIR